MKSGVVLAAIAVIGFLAFELYAATRNGYRMEPAFVFGEFVEARRGSQRCAAPTNEQQEQFDHNYAWARYRAGNDRAEADPAPSRTEIDAWLASREAELVAAVDARVDELDCKHPDVRKLVLRFRNLARLSLPAVPATRS